MFLTVPDRAGDLEHHLGFGLALLAMTVTSIVVIQSTGRTPYLATNHT